MFHRFSTWWRALSVVLLSLAAVAWPSATQALATPSFSVVHQGSVASLAANGSAHFLLSVKQGPSSSDLEIKLFPRILQRSQIAPIVSGAGSPLSPASSVKVCAKDGISTFNVEISTRTGSTSGSNCADSTARLVLQCKASSCDGVYPVSYSLKNGGTEWSLIVVRSLRVLHPLQLSWIQTTTATSLNSLSADSKFPRLPITIGANYQTLTNASTVTPKILSAFKSAVQSPVHSIISAPPGNIDFAGLVANGLTSQASNQLEYTKSLVQAGTGRYVDTPVLLTATPSIATLDALAGIGVKNVVFSENALSYAPSSSLHWGAPFHVPGASAVAALSIDEPLSKLMMNNTIEPARRAAIALGTIAFLHYEAPGLTAPRSVVVATSLDEHSSQFVSEFLSGLVHFDFATLSPLTPLFNEKNFGANGAPSTRTLVPAQATSWSARNIASLSKLIGEVASFNQGVGSPILSNQLSTRVAESQIVGSPSQRQSAIDTAQSALDAELRKFSVNPSTITLTGTDASLPITLLSRANYTMTAVVHLVSNRLTFPKGSTIVTSLDSSTKSLRVPVTDPKGGNLTLQVIVTTPNGQVVLAHSAVQVRIAGTSVVGYVISIGSLAVLALWWIRTSRRRRNERTQ